MVFDTVVLSNFSATGTTATLVQGICRPVTAPSVVSELEAGIGEGYYFLEDALAQLDAGALEIERPDASVETELSAGSNSLDPGEAGALAVAIQLDGIFASDDLDARLTADERGVPITGSIGLSANLVEQDVIRLREADEWLNVWMRENGYYSPTETVRELLDHDN